ncbi:helix-turn-helix transcriptional regulator [Pedobacter miscanthi]|uniref:helix-turn-helix domain-containing protein n=1 Tax=Pedobacter miscanthi TaxID=2259170 RepID=UPI00292DB7AF|nr:helix-turn-helix transcriptional regulator [Pedobacter miscanthi]
MVKTTESIEEFYRHKLPGHSNDLTMNTGQFNVFRVEEQLKALRTSPNFIRRDFFKIMLLKGNSIFHYGDRSIEVGGNTLMFFNPHVPYTYEPMSQDTTGYFCVFRDGFFRENLRINLGDLPLFSSANHPVFALTEDQSIEIEKLFEKIIKELDSDYNYKFELIKNYVSELIYLAIKLQPSVKAVAHPDAGYRIASVFSELLERQFPIENTAQRFGFRSPKIVAEKLSVHVNHLNRALKQTTGRTTTQLISERITAEAKALLRYTSWNIAEISYVLGFEDQAHFNNFFKKQTKLTPSTFRQV